jgi:hypothetical protein
MPRDHLDAVIDEWREQLPDVVGPSMALGKRIHRLALRLQEVVRSETAAAGLTPAEYDVLSALRRAGLAQAHPGHPRVGGVAAAEKIVRAVTGAQARLFAPAPDALVGEAADRLRDVLIALGDIAKED